MNNYVCGKPPCCRMVVQPKAVTTPQDLHLVAVVTGLKQPKATVVTKKAQFVDLVCQVFYHRHKRINNCWRVTLAVFPKRLQKVSSNKTAYTSFLMCSVTFPALLLNINWCDQEYMKGCKTMHSPMSKAQPFES